MRLMCPNCDAEYSVDDAAIPPSGRDVQCSNCGHAWFQLHPDAEREAEAKDSLYASVAPPTTAATPAATPAPAPVAAAEAGPPVPPHHEATAEPEEQAAEEAEATVVQAQPAAAPVPRTLDENLLAILREEAARETAVRRAEAPAMPEVQPDLGLPAAAPTAAPAEASEPAPAEPPRAAPVDLDAMEAAGPMTDRVAPRRDLLPDIEEINSTLRAGSEARGADAEALAAAEKARNRGGFRAGFIATLIVAVLMAAAYTMAPRIAQHLPGSAPMMASYVAGVDVARLWLDETMQKAAGALRGLTGESP